MLQAHYLALGLVSVICVLSPERILLGGGVMRRPSLLPLVHREVEGLMNGYQETATIMLPALAPRSGVLGAIALAEAREGGPGDASGEQV
jgi:fructokinase